MMPIPIFVGYDPRETVAFHVCVNSIIRHATKPISIIPLALNLFSEYTEIHQDGSNDFTYLRFLVPYLMHWTGPAIYIDGDMVVRDDIVKLWNCMDYSTDVMVVKHDYKTRMTQKYLGSKNEDYPRKNWSSVILWNCAAFPNRVLTPEFVQNATGAELHRFSWIKDERIGELDIKWNWLPDELGENKDAALLHYTLGTPCFTEFTNTSQAEEWHKELALVNFCKQKVQINKQVDVYHDLPQEIKTVFDNILKYRVDPTGEYHNVGEEQIMNSIKNINTNSAVAIDSEFRYKEKKGLAYDPVLENFILGAGGQISTWSKVETSMTPCVIRGITKRKEMAACKAAKRDFYYIDTGYFGNGKKKLYHRVTRNDVQNFGPVIDRPTDRLETTGFQPCRFKSGSNILLAPPSQKLLNLYDINLESWILETIDDIKKHTDRKIVVRYKQGRSTRVNDDTIEMALSDDVHCLVTFSSIAATEALLFGKPAFTLGPNAAAELCLQDLALIETPYIPSLDEVATWAAHLSYSQFTEIEMRNGTAWRILQDAIGL